MAKRRKRTNRNVPAKGRLRDIADQLWSIAVRGDWNWNCAVCGHRKTEAHHLVPRQHEATRYELRNGIALCAGCHQFNPDVSPHQNAAAWLKWLEATHPDIFDWYLANPRPVFHGTKNANYYIEVIQGFREYVSEEDFDRIVGVRFSAWLSETEVAQ